MMDFKNSLFIISSCFIFVLAATLQAKPESPWAILKKADLPSEFKENFFSYTLAANSPELKEVVFDWNFGKRDINNDGLQWSDVRLLILNGKAISLYSIFPKVALLFPGSSNKIPEPGSEPPQYLLVSDFLWSPEKPRCVFFIKPLNDKQEFLRMVVVDLEKGQPQIRTEGLTRPWLVKNAKKTFWRNLDADDQDPGGDDPKQPEPAYVKNSLDDLMDFAWGEFEVSKGSLKWVDGHKVEFELSVFDGQQTLQMEVP